MIKQADKENRPINMLGVNERRMAELDRLRQTLSRSTARLGLSTWWECVTAMMAPKHAALTTLVKKSQGVSMATRLDQKSTGAPGARASRTAPAFMRGSILLRTERGDACGSRACAVP